MESKSEREIVLEKALAIALWQLFVKSPNEMNRAKYTSVDKWIEYVKSSSTENILSMPLNPSEYEFNFVTIGDAMKNHKGETLLNGK